MNEGCGRKIKIRTGKQLADVLESVVSGLGNPGDRDGEDVELPADVLEREQFLQFLVSAGNVEYPCCTIIHGDCRDHLWRFPARSFDLIVTDPPYGMNITAHQEHHRKIGWDGEYPVGILNSMMKVCDLARLASYFFCRWDNLWEHEKRTGFHVLPRPKSMLVWHKVRGGGGTGDCLHEHTRDYEMAYFYPGPEHKFKHRPKSVLRYKAPGNNSHPTQKPSELIKEILGWYECETVLDPYIGSGTTAVAALLSKKHFLGFEADEAYYKDAVQRIADIKAQPKK